jgi:hypothetical protein
MKTIMPGVGKGNNPKSWENILIKKHIADSVQCCRCRAVDKKTNMVYFEYNGFGGRRGGGRYAHAECLNNKKIISKKIVINLEHGLVKKNVQCCKCKQVKPKSELINAGYTKPNNNKYKCKGGCNDN